MRLPVLATVFLLLLTAAALVAGCGGVQGNPQGDTPIDPASDPSTQPAPPVEPKAVLAYLDGLLRDDSRLVMVNKNKDAGELDDAGRKSLRAALARWWAAAEREPPEETKWLKKLTPDMAISIYGKGSAKSADAGGGRGGPVARIGIYRARQYARVVITDPERPRLGESVLVINSPDPLAWVTRLFAGQL